MHVITAAESVFCLQFSNTALLNDKLNYRALIFIHRFLFFLILIDSLMLCQISPHTFPPYFPASGISIKPELCFLIGLANSFFMGREFICFLSLCRNHRTPNTPISALQNLKRGGLFVKLAFLELNIEAVKYVFSVFFFSPAVFVVISQSSSRGRTLQLGGQDAAAFAYSSYWDCLPYSDHFSENNIPYSAPDYQAAYMLRGE